MIYLIVLGVIALLLVLVKVFDYYYIRHRVECCNESYGGDWYYNEQTNMLEDSMTDRRKPL